MHFSCIFAIVLMLCLSAYGRNHTARYLKYLNKHGKPGQDQDQSHEKRLFNH